MNSWDSISKVQKERKTGNKGGSGEGEEKRERKRGWREGSGMGG